MSSTEEPKREESPVFWFSAITSKPWLFRPLLMRCTKPLKAWFTLKKYKQMQVFAFLIYLFLYKSLQSIASAIRILWVQCQSIADTTHSSLPEPLCMGFQLEDWRKCQWTTSELVTALIVHSEVQVCLPWWEMKLVVHSKISVNEWCRWIQMWQWLRRERIPCTLSRKRGWGGGGVSGGGQQVLRNMLHVSP